MKIQKLQNKKRDRRAARTRAKIFGTAMRPRLAVFRSNAYTAVQLIDDEKGMTVLGASTRGMEAVGEKSAKVKLAEVLGERLAAKAIEKGITGVVFDRGSYKYHGRVKAVADGLRRGGLIF